MKITVNQLRQIISTSQRFFSLDAFSCKTFDVDRALGVIRDVMGVESENVHVVRRYKPVLVG